ncbi:cation/H(+) antiporter 15-like [Gastrolobium bilobum]|uniref:cation/H(+) antiporter 15-like n=1 Tax=Gastrolobium bilobum TaxID=150636 RepID=UPI002AB2009D|nr:cation/H(+) antiporter 15-like [Gastrolobium bilobum]
MRALVGEVSKKPTGACWTGYLFSSEVLGPTHFMRKLVPIKSIVPTETISYVGLVYYVFLAGLEMNLDTILQARKKATSIAIAGTIIPMAMGGGMYALVQKQFKRNAEYFSQYNTTEAYLFWALIYSVTGFPILTQILADLKLIYTGLGRVALTAAMVSDFYNWVMFAMLIPFANKDRSATHSVLSTIIFVLFCFIVIRPYLVQLIVDKTNQNEWDNYQLFLVVMGAFVCAFVTDILGTHPVVGALVYGIMLPRGKFTQMLIAKSEDFGAVYLAPLFFARSGIRLKMMYVMRTQGLTLVVPLLLLSFIPKILSTLIATSFFGMPSQDGVALGVLMNTKGILPLILLNVAWDKRILSVESSTFITASVLLMTLLVPLIVNAIYKPRKLHKQKKRRTIQNLKAEAELRVLACVHNPRHATEIVNIIEACNTIKMFPLRVFALQLVELTGNVTSLLTAHINQLNQQQTGEQALTKSQEELESITNIFNAYAEENSNTRVEILSAVSTYSTIHEDIYNVAQEKQASLILLPFHKQSSIEGVLEITNNAFKDINQNVMRDAPCSVGIYVDRGLGSFYKVNLRVIMIFIGGPDDHEALTIAWKMSRHEGIQLSIVRIFLRGEAVEVDTSSQVESHGLLSAVLDNEKQKELDDEYISFFRLKAVNNEDSITYSEKEVHFGEDIPTILHDLDQIGYDLYILGQGVGRNTKVMSELMQKTESPELGVIGDMVASNDFGSCSSLLVVQQYGFGGMSFEKTTKNPSHNDGSGPLFVKLE